MQRTPTRLLGALVFALSTSTAQGVPTADANGPYVVNEGAVVTLDGSGSSAVGSTIVLYEWDLDNDGSYDDATGETVTYSFPDGPLSWTVGLRVRDDAGSAATDTAQVDVLNVAPSLQSIADFRILSGMSVDVSTSFSDPAGSLDADFDYSFDWGDGAPPTLDSVDSVVPISASHIYTGSVGDMFVGTATVTDKDGGVGSVLFRTYIVESIPTPATLALFGVGLAALAAARQRGTR